MYPYESMAHSLLILASCFVSDVFIHRITDQSVSSFLSSSGRKLWNERAKKKWLVLVDEMEASEVNSPIMALRDSLIKVCCTDMISLWKS